MDKKPEILPEKCYNIGVGYGGKQTRSCRSETDAPMKKHLFFVAVLVAGASAITLWPHTTVEPEAIADQTPEKPPVTLSHRQEVWINALEWCESQGVTTAINEEDLDGTPSYYSFQFKPSTFKFYGELYGVIEAGVPHEKLMELLKSHDLQKEIVTNMIHDPGVEWEKQFPGCVKKLGRPPKD